MVASILRTVFIAVLTIFSCTKTIDTYSSKYLAYPDKVVCVTIEVVFTCVMAGLCFLLLMSILKGAVKSDPHPEHTMD